MVSDLGGDGRTLESEWGGLEALWGRGLESPGKGHSPLLRIPPVCSSMPACVKVSFLSAHTKKFKDANFNVVKEALDGYAETRPTLEPKRKQSLPPPPP